MTALLIRLLTVFILACPLSALADDAPRKESDPRGTFDPGVGYLFGSTPGLGSYNGPSFSLRTNLHADWFVFALTVNAILFGMEIGSGNAYNLSSALSLGARLGRFRVMGGLQGEWLYVDARGYGTYFGLGPYASVDYQIIKYLAVDLRYRGSGFHNMSPFVADPPGMGHSIQIGLSFPIPFDAFSGGRGSGVILHHHVPPPVIHNHIPPPMVF
jgi:hypothetical protein